MIQKVTKNSILPVNTQHRHDTYSCELIANIHNDHGFAHEIPKYPLSVSDKLVNVKRHHQQKEEVGNGQVEDVNV